MFGPPGMAYIYFTYGNHWMLNFVTEVEGRPAAVLIRAIEPTAGVESIRRRRSGIRRTHDLTNGPGKLTKALGITGRDNGVRINQERFQISHARRAHEIAQSGRVGVNDAPDIPWRFFAQDNPWVSAYRPGPKRRSTAV